MTDIVSKKFVHQNDGALSGSHKDLVADSILVNASGTINLGGNIVGSLAAGIAPTDAVNVSQLESYVSSSIFAVDSVNDSQIAELSGALSSEISSRISGDSSLSTLISNEASTRVSGEASLSTLISNEASSRVSAITALDSVYVNVAGDTMTGALTINANLTVTGSFIVGSGVDFTTIDDNSIDLSGAGAAATSIEPGTIKLFNSSGSWAAPVADEDVVVKGYLNQELSSANSSLSSAISTETSSRVSAVSSLNTLISSETSRATSAEGSLQNSIDTAIAGLTWKNSVKAMATGSIALSGLQTIDEVTLAADNRVLVNINSEGTGSVDNGIWIVAAGAWSRSSDMNDSTPINEINSAAVFVEQGAVYADTGWVQVLNVTSIGVNPAKFVQFNGAAGITAGEGLLKVGNTLSISSSYTAARDSVAASLVASLSSNVSSSLSSEISSRLSGDSSLASLISTEISSEASSRVSGEASLSTLISTQISSEASSRDVLSGALDTRLVDIEDHYLDKRVGGLVTGSLELKDVFLATTSSFDVHVPMTVSSSLKVGSEDIELVPVVAKLNTSGSSDTDEASGITLYPDLTSFSGMVMINFMVVAMNMDGTQDGMSGEYRMTAWCNAGALLVSSVVEIEQAMVGNAVLDVNILSDGTVRVQNDFAENRGFNWHVQRVKMVAVAANGDVK